MRFLCVCATLLALMPLSAADWPHFRGPNLDGHAPARGVFQGKSQFGLKMNWRVKAGSGYAGIAVSGDALATMYVVGENDVVALHDANTGALRWTHTLAPMYVGHDGSHDGPIGTPAIHKNTVFALGPRGQFVALDIKDGKVRWSHNLIDDLQSRKPFYGFSTSPIVFGDRVYLMVGGEKRTLVAFDVATGAEVWGVGDDNVDYQTPVLWKQGDDTLLVAAGAKHLIGVDMKSGEPRWSHEHKGSGARGLASLSPVPAGGERLFLAHQDDGSTMVSVNQEAAYDTVWEGRAIRNSYNVAIHHEGYLYAFSSRILACVDVATGKPAWRSRQPGDGFMTLVDGHLLIHTKEGSLHVIEASPEGYREKAMVEVFDETAWSSPAFADGSVYLRSMGHIARVDITDGAALAANEAADQPGSGSGFGKFLADVNAAGDKDAVIKTYLAKQDQTPIIEGDWAHFVYYGEAEDVALAGDMFGARQERVMYRVAGTNLFYYSQQLPRDAMLAYVFIKNFREMEADPRNGRDTQTFLVSADMEFNRTGEPMAMSWFAMPDWREPGFLGKPDKPGVTKTHELESAALETKHSIQVHLPHNYDANSDRRYPTLYVHGGVQARQEGHWLKALDNLMGGEVEDLITVFIDHQARGPNPKYFAMMTDELVPFIDKLYRTRTDAASRANIGAGGVGGMAIAVSLSQPDLFGKTGVNSMILLDTGMAAVQGMAGNEAVKGHQIYMDWGAYDLRNPDEAWDIRKYSKRMADFLTEQGLDVIYETPTDGTDWTAWRTRTASLLKALFPATTG